MGVDFYSCAYCDKIFANCSYYFKCECGKKFCSNECAKLINESEDEDIDEFTCRICRNECISDFDLLNFYLDRENKSREWLEELYKDKHDKRN